MKENKYMTNPLSVIPGGQRVTIEYFNGNTWSNDRVKHPANFVKKILSNPDNEPIERILVDGELYWRGGVVSLQRESHL
jgi:hypothetical protein